MIDLSEELLLGWIGLSSVLMFYIICLFRNKRYYDGGFNKLHITWTFVLSTPLFLNIFSQVEYELVKSFIVAPFMPTRILHVVVSSCCECGWNLGSDRNLWHSFSFWNTIDIYSPQSINIFKLFIYCTADSGYFWKSW